MTKPKLPQDCEIFFEPEFLSAAEADHLYELLKQHIDLQPQEIKLGFGATHILDTPKTIFTSEEIIASGKLHEADGAGKLWLPELAALRQRLEEKVKRAFGVCVCIYYQDGSKGVDYHSDLRAFGDTSCIPSLSLGAQRVFSLRNLENPQLQYEVSLPHGSLIVMGENCQERYAHALLPDAAVGSDRINLTFRAFGNQS